MSMSDEQFEQVIDHLANYQPNLVASLRARDTAQREALARVEAERDGAWLNAQRWRKAEHTAQAQLAEAVGLLSATCATLTYQRQNSELHMRISSFLARHAQGEQQEAQGAQAGETNIQAYQRGWDDRAAIATQPAAGEPVYQCRKRGGCWSDCSKHTYDSTFAGEEFEKRILWTAPSAAEPMAVGDPVAWRQIGHKVRLEWFETKGGWMDGAPPKFLADGVKEGWCRLELAYATPPAAAHGDEAGLPDNLRTHRRSWLNAMERLIDLEPGGLDPTAEDLNGYWCHELQAMRDMYADLDRIDAMRAQAGEGGEV